MSTISRRSLLSLGLAATSVSLAGCSGSSTSGPLFGGLLNASGTRRSLSGRTISKPNYAVVYASYPGEPAPVKEFDYSQVDLAYLRQEVEYLGTEEPGTVVVDPASRHLYFVEAPGGATRYGVGVGREGFGWSGTAKINMRRSWPDWVPPKEMVARDPEIRSQLVATSRGRGVPGGPTSPLGARAMYLFADGGDTGYRIHGTTEPETIGTDVSSGCIRMVNQDVIHLYQRVPEGTQVIVLS
ncbi:MAG TPA: L,D-transpeptidase [Gemmatimonadales bacterium]|nr:L,D-transpeptidase [Gemmatimonadales bacterium]